MKQDKNFTVRLKAAIDKRLSAAGIRLSNEIWDVFDDITLDHLQGKSTSNDFDDFEDDFIPCSRCDGHPACEDFGCAYEVGLGRMVEKNKEPGNDFDY